MGLENFNNGVDADRAAYERQNRLNPPQFAPGQEVNGQSNYQPVSVSNLLSGGGSIFDNSPQDVNVSGMEDDFSNPFANSSGYDSIFDKQQSWGDMQSVGMSNNPFNNPFNNGFNSGNSWGPSQNGMMQPYQNQQYQGLTYEKAEELMVKGTKSVVKGAKASYKFLSNTTPLYWFNFFKISKYVGLVFFVISLFMLVSGSDHAFGVGIFGFALAIGSLGMSMVLSDAAAQCDSMYKEQAQKEITTENVPMPTGAMFDMSEFAVEQPKPITDLNLRQLDVYEGDEDEGDNDGDNEIEDDFDLDKLVTTPPVAQQKNPEEVIQNMANIDNGLYTRQYLYEAFISFLPNICPDFSELKEISADDKAFYAMEQAVREAAECTGCKEDVELLKLQENYATIVATTNRPMGLNYRNVADELGRIYAYKCNDYKTDEERSRVYAEVKVIGKQCIYTIFTGRHGMISLKDMYDAQAKDYVLDTQNVFPVVFGLDPLGNAIMYDMAKLESIIIAGMPRSGKSWMAQNMITQMAAFTSPKELEFYICDPKGDISDFKAFCLPHVKRFESTDEGIVETMRFLVKEEAPRRKRIIGAGDALTSSVNIWDYKRRYPDVDLPIIYILIDEVVTIASRLQNEDLKEFRALLRELISQCPALGIRAILIPHVLKNDIIEKKTSDLVLCRISVMGTAEHIESVCGDKKFPWVLSKPGDMAVKMNPVSQNTMYLRSPVLTASNPENRVLFDYMRRVWTKLEPDSVKNSVARQIQEDKEIAESLTDNDLDDLDIFDADGAAKDFKAAMNR